MDSDIYFSLKPFMEFCIIARPLLHSVVLRDECGRQIYVLINLINGCNSLILGLISPFQVLIIQH